jgi:hypothetical protein
MLYADFAAKVQAIAALWKQASADKNFRLCAAAYNLHKISENLFTKMIQRIQTIFLALIAILHIALFFTPFWVGSSPSGAHAIYDAANLDCTGNICSALNSFHKTPNAMQVSNIMIIIGALATIFLFNNRMLQMRLARFLILSGIVQAAIMVITGERMKAALAGTDFTGNYSFGIAFPVITIILAFLAMRRIQHDENLVRSADRLR